MSEPWIGVDLDGTLAHYEEWLGIYHIGDPVPEMLARVMAWLQQGRKVKLFTARVSVSPEHYSLDEIIGHIHDWCERHGLPRLEVTCTKDLHMVQLWDDRCVQVVPNTGRTLEDEMQRLQTRLALYAGQTIQPG